MTSLRNWLFSVLVLPLFIQTAWASAPKWLQINIGTISSASEAILDNALTLAEKEQDQGVIIVLDSPGGSLDSTRHMVKALFASSLPIVVWVGPSGAHAGSAGAFITLAANVAAMAPASNIGAAHPVEFDGSNIDKESDLDVKIENDTMAFMESIAAFRKRNVAIAASLVANSLAVTADDALKNNLIDLIATSPRETLESIDGKVISLNAQQTVTIQSKNATIDLYTTSFKEDALAILSNPTLFYILFVAGILGIILEFMHPASILPGVLGATSLILSLIAGSILPINVGASLLILGSILCMVAEIFVPSFGVLGLGGFAGFIVGSLLLIDGKNSWGLSISLYTILPSCFLIAGVFISLGILLIRSRRMRHKTGGEALVGETGIAVDDFTSGQGMLRLNGELWSARVPDGTFVQRGDRLGVVARDGLMLSVRLL
ncbi:MAG: nodulation protein NfeD [Chitinophagaceae bacterium]|nr:nodulation protein NfeD [Oligoflexus sp.]